MFADTCVCLWGWISMLKHGVQVIIFTVICTSSCLNALLHIQGKNLRSGLGKYMLSGLARMPSPMNTIGECVHYGELFVRWSLHAEDTDPADMQAWASGLSYLKSMVSFAWDEQRLSGARRQKTPAAKTSILIESGP